MPHLSTKASSWLEKAYLAGLVFLLLYIPFHAFFSVSLGVISRQPLLMKAAKEMLLLILVIAAVVILLKHREVAQRFVRSRLNQLAVAFAGIHSVIGLFLHSNLGATLAGFAIDTRFVVFFLAVRLGMLLSAVALRRYMIKVFVGTAAIVLGFGLLQQYLLPRDILRHVGYGRMTIQPYLTVDKNPNFIRINSTLRGPNPLGAYTMIVIAGLSSWLIAKWRVLSKPVLVCGGLAILAGVSVLYASYSRSAWVGVLIALAGLVYISIKKQHRKRATSVIGVAIIAVGVGYLLIKDSTLFQTIIIHDDPATQSQRSSDDQHAASIVTSLKDMAGQPFGAGIGSTGSSSYFGESKTVIENQYLFTAHEAGWLGFVLFIVLQAGILYKLYQNRRDWFAKSLFVSGLGLIFVGMTLPVFADDTISYLWWGLAAVGVYVIEKKDHHGNAKSSN